MPTTENGIAWWAVTLFVFIAGTELDLRQAWLNRRETVVTAGLALVVPLATGCAVAAVLLAVSSGWMGPGAERWQFIAGVGMSCAVTALPILMLLMDKLAILRQPLGQRVLRGRHRDLGLDKAVITNSMFTALLRMAVASTMLTVPLVAPRLARTGERVARSR